MQERFDQASNKDTMLTAFFKLNQYNENARTILYHNIKNNYVYDSVVHGKSEKETIIR